VIALKGNPATARGVNLNDPTNYDVWAAESLKLAKDVAYKGMRNGVIPGAAYNAASTKVVWQRVAWGGLSAGRFVE